MTTPLSTQIIQRNKESFAEGAANQPTDISASQIGNITRTDAATRAAAVPAHDAKSAGR